MNPMSPQETKKIEEMNVKEIAEYLGIPVWLVQSLMCNWIESTPLTGASSCIATDEFNTWSPVRIAILNSLPLNAIERPIDLRVYPVNAKRLLEFLSSVPNIYTCFVGHPATANVISKYINVKCVRGEYRYNGEIIVSFVLRNRPQSGAEVNVTEDDLLGYIVYPTPILDNA